MNKVTRILTSAIAVALIASSSLTGLITSASLVGVPTPAHAAILPIQLRQDHVQTGTVQAFDNSEEYGLGVYQGWDAPYSPTDVDYASQSNASNVGAEYEDFYNYNHAGEYVYYRITPIADDFHCKLKITVPEYAEWDVVLTTAQGAKNPSDVSPDVVIGAGKATSIIGMASAEERMVKYDKNLICGHGQSADIFDHVGVEDTSAHLSYTFKIAVPKEIRSHAVSGVYATGNGVYVESWTYHQAYNGD
ncbi:MAG: hypothetical protein LBT37_03460 [Lactobacillaceae bacterium]|jgi:hypothetical protein|nr:hypothetical protein [Lactobacillaceae bacterium]